MIDFYHMKKLISDLEIQVSKEVLLRGWVYNFRSSGKVKFLILRDGSGICQCVFVKNHCDTQTLEAFESLSQETSVEVRGLVKKEPRAPGGYELEGRVLKILNPSSEYPISPKEHGIDFLMNHRHLWLRSKKQHAILRVRSQLLMAIREFFHQHKFTLVDAPIFTPNPAEGSTTLFETQYFDETTYLSQTGQLYMEAAAASFGKVYCLGPTFRAEKSKTRRHLIEFWMVEPEVAFFDLYDNMKLAEEFVEFIVQKTLENSCEELKILERDTSGLENIKAPFYRIHYKEAVKKIKESHPHFEKGSDFGAKEETLISELYDKPVFVHHFPQKIKAFYMKEDEKESGYSMSCDLLATESYGEIIGGGQREEDFDKLASKIKEHHLNLDHFQWYMDLRRYGSFVHSGFGLGIERTLAWICGLSHIREAIPFPRTYGRHYP